MVSDGAGGAIVAWDDERTSPGYVSVTSIYGQRVTGTGKKRWGTDGAVVAPYDPFYPGYSNVASAGGGAIVTWKENTGVYAQRLDSNGAMLWTSRGRRVPCSASQTHAIPIADGANGAVVCFETYNGEAVYAQRLNANGDCVWPEAGILLGADVHSYIRQTDACSDGAGGALAVWRDRRFETTHYGLYAQRVDTNGTVRWAANGVKLSDPQVDLSYPAVCSDGAGGGIFVWYCRPGSQMGKAFAQRVTAGGNTQWTTNGLLLGEAMASLNAQVQIIPDGAGGAIIARLDVSHSPGGIIDIYCQRVDASGTLLWGSAGVSICSNLASKADLRMIGDGVGGAIIVWRDGRGADPDLYAQRINASGNVLWPTEGVAISTRPGNQLFPRIVSDGQQGAFIGWQDEEVVLYNPTPLISRYKLHLNRVDANGQLVNTTAAADWTGFEL
jgi:hypothetical protein